MRNKILGLVVGLGMASTGVVAQPGYLAGDFHQHSTFTDGSWSLGYMMNKDGDFGLDWWANSEHGGGFTMNGLLSGIDKATIVYWDQMTPNPILGTYQLSGGHQVMWRWQSLRDYSFPYLLSVRGVHHAELIFQDYEMNVPGHEHGSVCVLGEQFDNKHPNANALAEFEYKFDNNDADQTGGAANGWVKSTLSGHAKTLEAIDWLEANYPDCSWLIPAHPERQKKYNISHFRDMNNHGPDVCFGFESMPGHQKGPQRGGYSSGADGGGTYGGCGVYAAKVGGLWDAMLSEGRHWWLFASSDFHDTPDDFYPGEYQKTYTYVQNRETATSIIDGLRSGNSWVVEGDLIDRLDFKVIGNGEATMGETVEFNKKIMLEIIVRDPQSNNYHGENPVLDHVDLIMGSLTGIVDPTSPDYNTPLAPNTHVIARFDNTGGVTDGNGLTSIRWKRRPNGVIYIKYELNPEGPCYFRLRGTNLGIGIAGETDANGNPLLDVVGANNANIAWHDLWFYSNPVFAVLHENHLKEGANIETGSNMNSAVVTVYPNPCKEILFLTNVDDLSKIIVIDLNGRTVLSSVVQGNAVNVSKLSSGTYVAKVISQGRTMQIKFVKE